MARSNDLTINVAKPPTSQQYDASGATSVSVTIESPFALATRAKVSRLTYEDHRMKFPADQGMKFANAIAGRTLTFFTRRMQGR